MYICMLTCHIVNAHAVKPLQIFFNLTSFRYTQKDEHTAYIYQYLKTTVTPKTNILNLILAYYKGEVTNYKTDCKPEALHFKAKVRISLQVASIIAAYNIAFMLCKNTQ